MSPRSTPATSIPSLLLSVPGQVLVAVGLFGLARGLLILSAPDILAMVDQATWKHADLAGDLTSGRLPGPGELAALAWNGFNFHQVAFIPYCLGFALFSLPFGDGYVSLHLYAALFSALGVAGWALLLARHGPRFSAVAFAIFMALAPMPAAMMQVRPYSGHTEAQGLAAAAIAVLLLRAGSPWLASLGRLFVAALLAGMAISLSPLAAPVLACAALGLAGIVFAGHRPDPPGRQLGALALGLGLGLLPYLVRAVFAPDSMFSMPVVEYDQADPASILKGSTGPTLAAVLSQPFHLVLDLSSVTQAHSYEGLASGDSRLANGTAVLASVLCVFAAWRAREPGRRVVALVLAAGPWATLALVGIAGPALCLRYLTGIYPLVLAGFAWCLGMLCEAGPAGAGSWLRRAAALLVTVAALLSWTAPGARDLGSVTAPARWSAALSYAPGPLLSSTGLRTMPPVELWDETLAFLAQRELANGGWQARGFDLPFLPLDDMSTQGWQPFPELSTALVAQRARASGEDAEHRLQNMGWALAMASAWDAARFEQLLGGVDDSQVLASLHKGAAEGAAVRGHPWPAASEGGASRSRMLPEGSPNAGSATTPGEVQ